VRVSSAGVAQEYTVAKIAMSEKAGSWVATWKTHMQLGQQEGTVNSIVEVEGRRWSGRSWR
jgi:hypothetical protein